MASKLLCLRDLIESFRPVDEVLHNLGTEFILHMLEKEYEHDKTIIDFDDVYLKLCGNNCRETCYRLHDVDLPPLCAALLNAPVITSLDLRYNRITDEGAITVGHFLEADFMLRELNLMGNDIGVEGARCLAEGLKTNQCLKILKMTGNKILSRGGIYLAYALQTNHSLTHIDVGDCDMDIASTIAFATILRSNKSIISLNVSRQILFTHQEEQTVHMKEMLCLNNTLRELHLSKCDMCDFGAKRLSEALERNRTLQVLDLSVNRISCDGAARIAWVLGDHCSLTVLDLSYNRIQCDGTLAIANALKKDNTRLIVLAIAYNEVQARGLCGLGKVLFENDSLRHVYIWGNEIDEETADIFAQLLLIGRLTSGGTDVTPFEVDGHKRLANLNNDCDYRRYRYSVPWWKGQAPKDRSIALF